MRSTDRRSRREVLTGQLAAPESREAHISSLVVHVRPDRADAAHTTLLGMPGIEIHAEAAGKIIVTLETDTEADIVTRLNEISLLDGVMSATLVYHHVENAADGDPAARKG